VRRAVCFVALVGVTGCGSTSRSSEVHPDGRIGSLQIDVSTEQDVRDALGKPFKIAKVLQETGPEAVGHELYYRCGRGCLTVYAISNATGKLADYNTQSRAFVTERGSRVGMPARRAAAGPQDRRRLRGGALHPTALGRASHLREGLC
jgi:hypothetical protein